MSVAFYSFSIIYTILVAEILIFFEILVYYIEKRKKD